MPIKPVKWRRSPREIIAAAKAIIEKKKLAAAGLAPIKPVKFRRSPREIIAAAKAIIEKKEMARCMESNDESFKFVNEAAKPVHIISAVSVRPVYIKRPWHASHHKDHTSLRSSDRWANNWPKQDKGQCCIKSKLRQKYTTTEWKYPTSGWRKRARSEETSWTLPSTITLKSRHAPHHKGHTSLRSSDRWANKSKQDKGQCCIKK